MNTQYKNPALRQEAIGEPASIIIPREHESMFTWIKNTGRFKSDESDRFYDDKATDEIEDLLYQEEELDSEE